MSLEQSLMNLTLEGLNAPSSSALSFLPHPPTPKTRGAHSPNATPTHSPSNSQSYGYAPGYSNPNAAYRTASPVRSRSPSSPKLSRHRPTRSAAMPMPIPGAASIPAAGPYTTATSLTPTQQYPYQPYIPTASPPQGVPASPERERRSRHRDDPHRGREHRDRDKSRERRDRERAERLARIKGHSGFGVDDAGCLGGF